MRVGVTYLNLHASGRLKERLYVTTSERDFGFVYKLQQVVERACLRVVIEQHQQKVNLHR